MSARIPQDVLGVLDRCRTDAALLFLPPGQLDRKLYEAVNKVLVAVGGKWNRQARAHVFEGPAEDAIEPIILTGTFTDQRREFGFFETPEPIARRAIEWCRIEPCHRVLEPSAGRGAIARYVPPSCNLDCVEIQPEHTKHLGDAAGQARIDVSDFLSIGASSTYDRIVMNPPFGKQADILHVQHAFQFLRPDGRLIAIMSAGVAFRQDRRARDFRALVYECGEMTEIPAGSFKSSGTDVNTMMVALDAGAGR